MQAKPARLDYTSVLPAEDNPMRRFILSLVAVAAGEGVPPCSGTF
jgi:hypothetical protein